MRRQRIIFPTAYFNREVAEDWFSRDIAFVRARITPTAVELLPTDRKTPVPKEDKKLSIYYLLSSEGEVKEAAVVVPVDLAFSRPIRVSYGWYRCKFHLANQLAVSSL